MREGVPALPHSHKYLWQKLHHKDLTNLSCRLQRPWLSAAILCPQPRLLQTFSTHCLWNNPQHAWLIASESKWSSNFGICAPGEGGAGERAEPSDEPVWGTADGGVQRGNVQRGRSVGSCRDSTLPGALQLCRTHQSCGGKRTLRFTF